MRDADIGGMFNGEQAALDAAPWKVFLSGVGNRVVLFPPDQDSGQEKAADRWSELPQSLQVLMRYFPLFGEVPVHL